MALFALPLRNLACRNGHGKIHHPLLPYIVVDEDQVGLHLCAKVAVRNAKALDRNIAQEGSVVLKRISERRINHDHQLRACIICKHPAQAEDAGLNH